MVLQEIQRIWWFSMGFTIKLWDFHGKKWEFGYLKNQWELYFGLFGHWTCW
jgi:hypothetical protein